MTGKAPNLFQLAVDLVIFTVRHDRLHVLLVERGKPPFMGSAALPGGFVLPKEDPDHTAARELKEETGLDAADLHLEQLHCYAAPGRDPRGQVASIAYLAIAPDLPVPMAGTDAADAHWEPVGANGRVKRKLAFDHAKILDEGLERARAKLEYTTIATAFCPEPFTIADLRTVYEAVWGAPVDVRNFSRKVIGAQGFVVATEERRTPEKGRPAALYKHGGSQLLSPPMLRPGRAVT